MAKRNMRKLQGTIVSDKMAKTAVVEIIRWRRHPKYLKYYKISTRFKAHDEKKEYKVGDKVVIQETRPISKEKRWIIVNKLT
ncbi:MAG TPA: 30S ribosomal protein S17 [Candidatus Paceibacterota bacterium]